MTFSTTIPNLTGDIAPTSVTLPAGEAVLAVGTERTGALAQASGAAAGFNVLSPTANCAYRVVLRGQDSATGTPTNAFLDELTVVSYGATAAFNVLHSTTLVGTPGARTYSNNSGALKIALANGTVWYVDVTVISRFPA
jgi:hypothetical protein